MLLLPALIAAAAASTATAADLPARYDVINCRNVPDAPLKECQVAFVSRGGDKIAAYVTGPDGRVRILYFRRGQPTFSDAGSRLTFERNRDTFVIHVGRTELYEMPERLVTGD